MYRLEDAQERFRRNWIGGELANIPPAADEPVDDFSFRCAECPIYQVCEALRHRLPQEGGFMSTVGRCPVAPRCVWSRQQKTPTAGLGEGFMI